MSSATYDENAGADLVQEISSGMAFMLAECLRKHGDDPLAVPLIAAGISVFVKNADKIILPGLRDILIEMLRAKP